MRSILLCLLLGVSWNLTADDHRAFVRLDWHEIPELPAAAGKSVQPGLAGAFIGVHQDALIIAGGANFPDGVPWEGGAKVYHRDIYILEKTGNDQYRWFDQKTFKLPQKIAYGLTIPAENGLICIGGMDDSQLFSEVFLLKWNAARKEIGLEELPALPQPFANLSGGKIGNKIYVAAGSEKTGKKFFGSLDLSDLRAGWQELPSWDGAPRTHAVGVVQHNGDTECFYLFKGRFRVEGPTSTMHGDSWVYDPTTNVWASVQTDTSFHSAAGTGIAVGANHVLLFGGDDGELFNRLERLATQIESAQDTALQKRLIAERDELMKNHSGFSRDIWAFHTITQTWTRIGQLPSAGQVTTTAIRWGDRILIPSGEVSPGIRTPRITALSLSNSTSFGTLNYIILVVYLVLLVGIGFLFSKNQNSTEDFFKGGHRIPWWAAGLSIFGTQLSAITFMAIPAKTFATDWLYFFLMMTILMVAPLIIRYFLPFYRRFNLTTAYEYLELRFNLPTRLLGSSMYVFLQLGRLGIVLLLPSLALSVVTGFNVHYCILTMGTLSILYTVLGGIEAVIWTDVLQVIVLLGGALISLILLYLNLDATDLNQSIADFRKMRIFDLEFSFSDPTLWVVLIGGLASNIIQYGSDQTVIQRYLTTRDEKAAARGIMTGAWLTLPSSLIFFSLGTLLFVFYRTHPELLNPALEQTDTIFPWYIVHSLPQGVSGLLIAAVFAASMSSLDSSMNSVATVLTTDFFRRLRPQRKESNYLSLARRITVIIGLLGTGLALVMASWGISSLWDQFNLIVGLFAGGLGGIFLLGIFSKTTNSAGALTGLLLSGALQYIIKEYTNVHLLLYAFTGMAASVLFGWLASRFFGTPEAEKLRFTYFNLKKTNH